MNFDFPVERMRKIVGDHESLVSYYSDKILNSHVRAQYMFVNLAEVVYEDFMNWTESDFNRVDINLSSDLRIRMAYNGVLVERKAGLQISRALALCFKSHDHIPISDLTMNFCEMRTRTSTLISAEQRNGNDPGGFELSKSQPSPDVPSRKVDSETKRDQYDG